MAMIPVWRAVSIFPLVKWRALQLNNFRLLKIKATPLQSQQ
jgi:hypothetical protein